MSSLTKILFLFFFLFIRAYSNEVSTANKLGFDFSIGIGGGSVFGSHNDGVGLAIGNQQSDGISGGGDISNDNQHGHKQKKIKRDFTTKFPGVWQIDHKNVGVAAMQLQLMPNGKVVWFDTTNLGPSAVQFSPEWCRPLPNDPRNGKDCYAHAIEYDPVTSTYRTLKVDIYFYIKPKKNTSNASISI